LMPLEVIRFFGRKDGVKEVLLSDFIFLNE
jgi:hypothetical protein